MSRPHPGSGPGNSANSADSADGADSRDGHLQAAGPPGRRVRRLALTGRGSCLAVVGVCCLIAGQLAHYPGLLGVGLACLVATAVSLIGLATRRGAGLTRDLPGRPVRRLTPLTGRLRLEVPAGAPGGEVEVVESVAGERLPPRRLTITRRADVEYPVPTGRPGTVTVGPAELRFFGFAGLTRMRLVDADRSDVLVLARALPVHLPDSGQLPVDAPRADEVEGGGTELRALRPYVPGDDLRKVNARISARVGKLMIRQDAEPSISAVNLVVDNTSGTDPDCFAEMLDIATSICGAAERAGLPLGWTARGRRATTHLDAEGLAPSEVALARLALTDDPIPRLPGGDLTLVVCGPQTEVSELVHRLADGADHRMMVLLRITDPSAEAAGGGPAVPGVVLLSAPNAELVLRQLSNVGVTLAGAGR